MAPIPLIDFLGVAALLFGLGIWTALRHTSAILILMGIELMLNAVNLNLVAFARFTAPDPTGGFAFALFVLTVAAAEAAVGLAIVLMIVRGRGATDVNQVNEMRG